LLEFVQPTQVPSPYPYCGPEDGGLADPRFRFTLTSLSSPQPRCVGFARRRIGRGGRYFVGKKNINHRMPLIVGLFLNRVVLDRVYTPLDSAWGCLHGGDGRTSRRPSHHQKVLSEDFIEEIRTSWKHFRPASPPVPDTSTTIPSPASVAGVDCVSICADDDDKYQTFDTETIDQMWWPDPLSAIQADSEDVSSFHSSYGHSNFNVVGDEVDSGENHLDWWNYFDTDFVSASPPPPPPPEDFAGSGGGGAGKTCHTTNPTCIMNGVNSPSTATDSPFWIVPKSASLPNNDW